MFDRFIDAKGVEWQTKALSCVLDSYFPNDLIEGPPIDYQMEVIGGRDAAGMPACDWSFATVRDGKLYDLPVARDVTLPLREYSSGWHGCSQCDDCIHNGNKCCGCYDGACCKVRDPEPERTDAST